MTDWVNDVACEEMWQGREKCVWRRDVTAGERYVCKEITRETVKKEIT